MRPEVNAGPIERSRNPLNVGVDIGSIEFIHQTIVRLRDAGTAVLLVSAELDEILALSDRIAVMYKGQIMDVLDAKKANKENLGLLMAGVHPSESTQKEERLP